MLIDVKMQDAEKAFAHMAAGHAQQEMVRLQHSALYNEAVHSESLANNLQGLYTKLEG